MKLKSMLISTLALGCACAVGGETKECAVAQKLQTCDFLLNKDFKASAKYYLCLFSASWCGPCRREMPRIAKTYAEQLKANPDIELIHFSRDRNDEKALAWAKEHNVKFPVVKPKGGNPLNLHSRGIPHLFILKADGALVEEGHPMKLFTDENLRCLMGHGPNICGIHRASSHESRVSTSKVTIGDYTWSYSIKNGEVTIVAGEKRRCAISPSPCGSVTIPTEIMGLPVTSVGEHAFGWCGGLESVTIPQSVRNIGRGAFHWSGLSSVTIPPSVTNIDNGAFSGCRRLRSVLIPSGVTSIGLAPFSNCEKLESIFVEPGNASYVSRNGLLLTKDGFNLISGVNGDVVIPSGVITIERFAFTGNDGLRKLTIPSTVRSIGWGALAHCGGLTSLRVDRDNQFFKSENGLLLTKDGDTLIRGVNGDAVIPEGVKRIGIEAFSNSRGLRSVKIPSTVTGIGCRAFEACRELESLEIPPSVTTIDAFAFVSCERLTSVTICGERIDAEKDVFLNCKKLASIQVPANAKSWAGMKTWQGIPLDFSGKTEDRKPRKGQVDAGAVEDSSRQAVLARSTDVDACNTHKIKSIPPMSVPSKNVVAQKLQTCDFLLNKDFKASAKYYLCLFSASWCGPCRAEMPRIAKTYAEQLKADPDIELIHFSRDQNDEKALAWAKEHDVKFPVVKPNGGNPLNLHCRGIPHLFILKADGTLVEEGHPASLFNEEKIHLLAGKIGQVKANGYFWSYALYKGEVTITSPAGKLYEKAISPNPTGAIVVPSSIAGSTVTRLGKFALCKSPDLTSVKIPATVTSIGDWALSDCDKLVSVNIPSSVIRIGDCVFSECPRLLKIGVDARNPAYKAINGVVYAKDMKRLVTCAGGVETVTIPAGVVEIGDHAFRCCRKLNTITIPMSVTHIGEDAFCATALESVVIPSGVKDIENAAFWCCGRLESVTLHEGLESVGGRAFYQNWRLKSIRIPASVKKLGYGSFEDCRELCDVTMCGERPESSNNVFNKCDKLTEIHVPANAKSWAGMKEWQGRNLAFDAK